MFKQPLLGGEERHDSCLDDAFLDVITAAIHFGKTTSQRFDDDSPRYLWGGGISIGSSGRSGTPFWQLVG